MIYSTNATRNSSINRVINNAFNPKPKTTNVNSTFDFTTPSADESRDESLTSVTYDDELSAMQKELGGELSVDDELEAMKKELASS